MSSPAQRAYDPQTEQERLVVAMVLRHLATARETSMSGELSFRLVLDKGGVRDRYVDIKIRDC